MKYTINVLNDKTREFVTTYQTELVPVAGDLISLSDSEILTVEKRMLPANGGNIVLLFVKVN